MEITPKQLGALCAGLFGAVVALNFVQQWRSNEQFKATLATMDFNGWKDRLFKQEMMEEIVPLDFDPETLPVEQESSTEAD